MGVTLPTLCPSFPSRILIPLRDQPADRSALTDQAARNIAAIAALERAALNERSTLDRVTDAVTSAAGSASFLIVHAGWFGVWITVNLMRERPFDPFPFGFLMLLVSMEAIFLTATVLMTQNRMRRQADKRAHLDLQVNLLAEQELTAMLQMLNALSERMGVAAPARDTRIEQLGKETDIHQLASAVDRELAEKEKAATAPSSAPAPHTPSPHRS
jgi:uncharacterized membrane protein